MYSVGDLVVYGNVGVCKVEDIGVPALSAVDKTKEYYTLTILHKGGRVYAPVDTCTFMRPVLSRDEALSLIERIPFIDESIYEGRDMGMLKGHYQNLIHSYDCDVLVHLIKSVWVKRQTLAKNGKSLGQVEAQYMKRAEEMLYDELAVALDMPRDEVKAYLEDAVEKLEQRQAVQAGPSGTV